MSVDVASPPAREVSASRDSSIAGLPPGVRPAPPGRRLLAHVLDSWPAPLLLVLAVVVATRLPHPRAPMVAAVLVLLAVLWAGFVWFLLSAEAAGPGMRLARLQLVGLQDGRPVGRLRVALRSAVWWALCLSVIGLVAMLVQRARHPRGQGWHDLAADSLVISERPLARREGGKHPLARVPHPGQLAQAQAAGRLTASADVAATPERPHLIGQSSVLDSVGQPTSAREAAAAGMPSEAGASWSAVLDDGHWIPLDGRVRLVGRNPTAAIGEDATPVTVSDPSRTVSKTHLEIGLVDGVPYVRDRGSTNGSTVTTSSGLVVSCPAGQVVPVGADALVTFGDRHLRVRREDRATDTGRGGHGDRR